MSQTALFGADLSLLELGGSVSMPMSGDPAGALFERMFRDFSNAPERLPRPRPRNDIEATLDAMADTRMGFGEARAKTVRTRRGSRAATPKS